MKRVIFGITGTTGSGKTTISKEFEKLGVKVIDADRIYHSLVEKTTPCLLEICEFFGKEILLLQGGLDRKALAKIVFSDREKLKRLEKITHKHIKAQILKEIEGFSVCAIDAAVLIGSEIAQLCEWIVAVVADKNIRKKRIMQRDNLSSAEADERIASQRSDDFYRKNADFVVENNDGKNIEAIVMQIYKKIITKGE